MENTSTMAERLLALRKSRGMSREVLCYMLWEKYGVALSVDSLGKYERNKAGRNNGMRVEYLCAFADFFGVTTDFLLGLTDVRSTDVDLRVVAEYTRLSEKNIAELHKMKEIADEFGEFDYEFREKSVPAERLFLDATNDVLTLFRQDNYLLSRYYLLRLSSERHRKREAPKEDTEEAREWADGYLRPMGWEAMPSSAAVGFYSRQIGDLIAQYLVDKYRDGKGMEGTEDLDGND